MGLRGTDLTVGMRRSLRTRIKNIFEELLQSLYIETQTTVSVMDVQLLSRYGPRKCQHPTATALVSCLALLLVEMGR